MKWVLRAVWALLIGLLLINAGLHDPRIGYDAGAHRAYAIALSQGHLPSPTETYEYFSAPLSYLPMALLIKIGLPMGVAAKGAQLIQVGYAIVILLHIRWILGGSLLAEIGALGLLGAMNVWHRSFAMIRAEALLSMLVIAAVWQIIQLLEGKRSINRFAIVGVFWGLAMITRQWAFFPLVGVIVSVVLLRRCEWDRRWWAGVTTAAGVCALIAAPFYLSLYVRFGTVRPFNQPVTAAGHLKALPDASAVLRGEVFSPSQINRPAGILYTDWWGDYWGYFAVSGVDQNGKLIAGTRMFDAISQGMTKSNTLPSSTGVLWCCVALGLPLTLIICCALGVVFTNAIRRGDPTSAVLFCTILTTLIGYGWFVFRYTHPGSDTDTVKATYLLHLAPLLAISTGLMITKKCNSTTGKVIVILCVVGFAAALPAAVTRHIAIY